MKRTIARSKAVLSTVTLALGVLGCKKDTRQTSSVAASKATASFTIPTWDALPQNVSERVSVYRRIVETILKNSKIPLSAARDCNGFSQLWLEELAKNRGYKLHFSQTDGNRAMRDVKLTDGTVKKDTMTHIFVADRTFCSGNKSCDNEIIIDPTFVQFFEPGECLYGATDSFCATVGALKSFPKVLVGTHADLVSFYSKNTALIRLRGESGSDSLTGKYSAASAVSLIYSFGPNSSIRVDTSLF